MHESVAISFAMISLYMCLTLCRCHCHYVCNK